jgi:hypothetical protein
MFEQNQVVTEQAFCPGCAPATDDCPPPRREGATTMTKRELADVLASKAVG